MKKNKNILKKVCFVILGLFLSLQIFAQDNSFVYMEDGNFYQGCEDYYMWGVNYGIGAIQAADGELYISPTIDQCGPSGCSSGPPWRSCGNNPDAWKQEIINHFYKMDTVLGFNTVRLLQLVTVAYQENFDNTDNEILHVSRYLIQQDTSSDCYTTATTLPLTEFNFERQGDLLQQVIDIIYQEGLNLKLLPHMGGSGVEMLPDTYEAYLAYMAERFKDEPVVLGYDLYNEPVWFAQDNSFNKYEVSYICLEWYNAIKRNASSQLVTIGSKFYDLFKWDPEILPVDFVSFHPYAVKYESEGWTFNAPFERYKARLKYMSRNFSIPYLIGESGYSATDRYRSSCDTLIPHPSLGDTADQNYFAVESIKYTKWYGHKGYTWWKYKDTPWHNCDSEKAYQGLYGIVYLEETMGSIPEEHKPYGDIVINYKSYNDCSSCVDPAPAIYFNPTDTTQTTTLMYGSILDSTNDSIGIEDVFIWAYIKKELNDSVKVSENSFAITDSLGRFQIKTSYLLNDIQYVNVKYSKPGWIKRAQDYYTIQTDSVTCYLEPLNPDSIAQKPVYQSWTITDGMDTTWYNPQVPASNNIVVEDGASLTIKTSVYFNEGARLIVERGGKLIIDSNGKLTSNCSNDLWYGIEVQGTTDSAQNYVHQGALEVKNGGTIENALFGVYAGKTDSLGQYVAGYTGGIIRCDSAHFLNNQTAVYLLNYDDYSSASGFINTTFEINDDYMGSTSSGNDFVKIYNMNGIDFAYCSFLNNSSNMHYYEGVHCYNSGVNFVGDCTGSEVCDSTDYGLFKT